MYCELGHSSQVCEFIVWKRQILLGEKEGVGLISCGIESTHGHLYRLQFLCSLEITLFFFFSIHLDCNEQFVNSVVLVLGVSFFFHWCLYRYVSWGLIHFFVIFFFRRKATWLFLFDALAQLILTTKWIFETCMKKGCCSSFACVIFLYIIFRFSDNSNFLFFFISSTGYLLLMT